ncbi:MAG: hypothetical protein ACRDHO_03620 [Actinomycetota bacterium]
MRVPIQSSHRRVRGSRTLVVLVLLAAACAGSPRGGPPPSSSPGPSKTLPQLKLAVLAAVGGRIDYCDPDEYPVPHGTPEENARARFEMIKRDRAAFAAILEYEGLSPNQQFTDEQLLAISDDYKQMQAIQLEASGDAFRFRLLVSKSGSRTGNEFVRGTVSRSGVVKIEHREPGDSLNCPICLAAGVRIATPSGDVPVQDITVGMPIWTVDFQGRRILGVVLETGRTQAPLGHRVVRVTLEDGRSVLASPGHPTADGRTIGELRQGDRFDGSRVLAATRIPYSSGMTYDVLASGPTGAYFANGILLGTTLKDAVREVGSGGSRSAHVVGHRARVRDPRGRQHPASVKPVPLSQFADGAPVRGWVAR